MNYPEPSKALEEGESTYRNGDGAMCGGVISESMWQKDLKENGGYGMMMAFVMDDENFELYKRLKAGGKADKKAATELFNKKARSNI